MEIVYLLLGFVSGMMVCFIAKTNIISDGWKKGVNYFGSPIDKSFQLDWFLYKLLKLVSKSAGERWYESLAICNRGVFISLLCTIKLVTVVRYDFLYDDESKGRFAIAVYGFWYLPAGHIDFMNRLEDLSVNERLKFKEEGEKIFLYQIFIAGKNVVWDYMNGDLQRSWEERIADIN